jgi:hypothetical protein
MDDVWEETVKGTVGLEQVRGVRAHAHVTSVLSWGDVDGLSLAEVSSDGTRDRLRVTHKWRSASTALPAAAAGPGPTSARAREVVCADFMAQGLTGASGSVVAAASQDRIVRIWRVGDADTALASAFTLPLPPAPTGAPASASPHMSSASSVAVGSLVSEGPLFTAARSILRPAAAVFGTQSSSTSASASHPASVAPNTSSVFASPSSASAAPASAHHTPSHPHHASPPPAPSSSSSAAPASLVMHVAAHHGLLAAAHHAAICLVDTVTEQTLLRASLLTEPDAVAWGGSPWATQPGCDNIGTLGSAGLTLPSSAAAADPIRSVTVLAPHLVLYSQRSGVGLVDTRAGRRVAWADTHSADLEAAAVFRNGLDGGDIVAWDTEGIVKVVDMRSLCYLAQPTPLYGSARPATDTAAPLGAYSALAQSLCPGHVVCEGEPVLGMGLHGWAPIMAVARRHGVTVHDRAGRATVVRSKKGFMGSLAQRRTAAQAVSWVSGQDAVVLAYNDHDVGVAFKTRTEDPWEMV